MASLPRHKLHPAERLIIWSAPPGQDIFEQALALVKPHQIFVVGRPSPLDLFPNFIKQLMGLVKYAMMQREGEVVLPDLAAGLGHRLVTTRLGIDWLAAQGKLAIHADDDDIIVLRRDQRPPITEAPLIEEILISALAETAAYRRFFREANLASLKKVVS
jgi:hypothetical protein